MCGGLAFNLSQIPKKELEQYYPPQKIDQFRQTDVALSYFWDKNCVLPIIKSDGVHLFEWGNKDIDIKLPKTGWAKLESINQGKWQHLNPQNIIIPATRGYEKGVWFDIKGQGLKGILVNKEGITRVYMVTKSADNNYLTLTKHSRQPIEANL